MVSAIHIYAFEPDPQNYEIAAQNLARYQNVNVIPYGLWHQKSELRFESVQSAERISSHMLLEGVEKTLLTVPVTSLDAFFEDKPDSEWPTLIKLDVEGAEKDALVGATTVIGRKKPRLIICAYHKPEDIYELPQTIMKIRDDYQFSFWQMGKSF